MRGNLNDIRDVSLRIEQATLVAVDDRFQALSVLPPQLDGYPRSFRLPAKGHFIAYSDTTGRNGASTVDQHKPRYKFAYYERIGIAVGLMANLTDALDRLALDFVQPFYDAYFAHCEMLDEDGNPTIEFLEMGMFEIGEYKPRDTAHYAVIFPVTFVIERGHAVAPNG